MQWLWLLTAKPNLKPKTYYSRVKKALTSMKIMLFHWTVNWFKNFLMFIIAIDAFQVSVDRGKNRRHSLCPEITRFQPKHRDHSVYRSFGWTWSGLCLVWCRIARKLFYVSGYLSKENWSHSYYFILDPFHVSFILYKTNVWYNDTLEQGCTTLISIGPQIFFGVSKGQNWYFITHSEDVFSSKQAE